MQEVVRLHGLPSSIVYDRDPIFVSSFWRELFRLSGTTLRMSSAYHPETDGQTEVLNRCIETYLRCFSSENPKQWGNWLSWAEYCYNTSFQSAAGTTPFEVVYGRPPPNLQQYLPGEVRVQSVLETLQAKDEILEQLRIHLGRAQQRMVREVKKHRRDVQFEVGDMVYLKYRPFRQSSLFRPETRKLAPRFFGPFEVVGRIGATAYRLRLLEGSRVHPVFHVSLLKKAIGTSIVESQLLEDMSNDDHPILPEAVIGRRSIEREGTQISQVLIKWMELPEEDATWFDVLDFVY